MPERTFLDMFDTLLDGVTRNHPHATNARRTTTIEALLGCEEVGRSIQSGPVMTASGYVTGVTGPVIQAKIPGVSIGDTVQICRPAGRRASNERRRGTRSECTTPDPAPPALHATVVGLQAGRATLAPLGTPRGVSLGTGVVRAAKLAGIALGDELLGSVIDASGKVIAKAEGRTRHRRTEVVYGVDRNPPAPMDRNPIDTIFPTGIRALDSLLTVGQGQRLAVFAEPGVGKSSLIAQLATFSAAEVNVIALIGERGREVREFAVEALSSDTRKKTVIVASTSDEPAAMRARAALLAVRIAEYFRDQGAHVLLQIDSLTRLFRAWRELGLAAGEIPVRRGYPPSVFQQLPSLIERAGTGPTGSITAFYTALLSADIDEDPLVEELKGITDGHIILSRERANAGYFPAIDPLGSLSRLQRKLVPTEINKASAKVRGLLEVLRKERDTLAFGGIPSPALEEALALEPRLNDFLIQGSDERSTVEETFERLLGLIET